MTNPTTPLPVQEPAAPFDHVRAALQVMLHEARRFNAATMREAGVGPFDLVAIRQAESAIEGAAQAPVVQEPAGAVEAIKRLRQSLETWTGCEGAICNREDVAVVLDALASLPPVTQAKSEAVAAQYSAAWGDGTRNWINCTLAEAQTALKQTGYVVRWLYAAPREAVERQPLTEERISELWCEVAEKESGQGWTNLSEKFARAIEAAHGIGPATQEKQHG